MFIRTTFLSAVIGTLAACGVARAVVTEYTVETTWTTAASGIVRVINFDDAALAPGASLAIAVNRYAALAGAPSFVGVPSPVGSGTPLLFRSDVSDINGGIIPTSGQNLLQLTAAPIPRNGIVRITFNQPVVAVSGQFIDIETAAASHATGFRIGGALAAIDLTGASGLARFFGVVSSVPFTSVDLEITPTTDPNMDGLAFDDLKWVLASDCTGDVNGDGFTNLSDFNLVAGNFGTGPGKTRAQGDLSGDGFVTLADFNLLAGDFGCGS